VRSNIPARFRFEARWRSEKGPPSQHAEECVARLAVAQSVRWRMYSSEIPSIARRWDLNLLPGWSCRDPGRGKRDCAETDGRDDTAVDE
jgi:hypothetical protein